MAFTLHRPDAASEEYEDGDDHSFDVHGYLVIRKADGWKRIYSPSAWTYIEEYRDPNASIAGGYV